MDVDGCHGDEHNVGYEDANAQTRPLSAMIQYVTKWTWTKMVLFCFHYENGQFLYTKWKEVPRFREIIFFCLKKKPTKNAGRSSREDEETHSKTPPSMAAFGEL